MEKSKYEVVMYGEARITQNVEAHFRWLEYDTGDLYFFNHIDGYDLSLVAHFQSHEWSTCNLVKKP